MSSLDNVVKLNITRSAAAVSRPGFGIALILGASATGWGSDRIRTYTSPAAMLEDGFSTGDLEYKQASKLYSQTVKPQKFKVGRRLTAVAQVKTFTPDVTTQSIQHYIATIDGVEYDFTSDATPTAAEVVTGLIALINADSAAKVTASGTTTLILTADVAGIGFSATGSANLTGVDTTPNTGVATDIAQINDIDKDWYALILCDRNNEQIMEAAATIESMRRIFVTMTADAAVIAAGTTDIASRLKAKGYNRTYYGYSADQASGPEGAMLGEILPRVVGSYTAKFKSMAGITTDPLTDSQITIAKSKNANIYTVIAGQGTTEEGVVASGEFLDVIIGVDWIHVNMQADIFQILRDNPKIPMTNAGGATLEQAITNRLNLAVTNGILTNDPEPEVNVPLVSDLDPADKVARKFSGITFKAYLAGAVHAVEIEGNVSVF